MKTLIVDKKAVDKETKLTSRNRKIGDSAIKTLRQLETGQAIKTPMPEMCYERNRIRSTWGYRIRKVSQEDGKAFKTILADDGNSLFIQRIEKPQKRT